MTNFQLLAPSSLSSFFNLCRADSHDQLSITRGGKRLLAIEDVPCGFARPTFNYLLQQAKSRVCYGAVRIRTTNFQLLMTFGITKPSLTECRADSHDQLSITLRDFAGHWQIRQCRADSHGQLSIAVRDKRGPGIHHVPCGFAQPTFNYWGAESGSSALKTCRADSHDQLSITFSNCDGYPSHFQCRADSHDQLSITKKPKKALRFQRGDDRRGAKQRVTPLTPRCPPTTWIWRIHQLAGH